MSNLFVPNLPGQLGLGNDSSYLVPTKVEELALKKPKAIACGAHHSVAFNGR